MKAKKGYSGLESFPLSFSSTKTELLKLPGNDGKMRLINDLFDSGEDVEARSMLRKALYEVTHNLDRILAEGRGVSEKSEPGLVASLSLNVEV